MKFTITAVTAAGFALLCQCSRAQSVDYNSLMESWSVFQSRYDDNSVSTDEESENLARVVVSQDTLLNIIYL